MNSNNPKKNPTKLRPIEKTMLQLKTQQRMVKDPIFREKVQKMIEAKKKSPEYLTEAHRKNSEAAMKQQEEWDKSEASLEEILERQRQRQREE